MGSLITVDRHNTSQMLFSFVAQGDPLFSGCDDHMNDTSYLAITLSLIPRISLWLRIIIYHIFFHELWEPSIFARMLNLVFRLLAFFCPMIVFLVENTQFGLIFLWINKSTRLGFLR